MDFLGLSSMRIYPHLQDTGGFFIGVLQRKVTNEVKVVDLSYVYV
jgi:hypothetical protein